MGNPRAQGPDPYARFDESGDGASNIRHFPTPDRELGDNLKLSDLLGPAGGTDDSVGGEKKSAADDDDARGDAESKRDDTE